VRHFPADTADAHWETCIPFACRLAYRPAAEAARKACPQAAHIHRFDTMPARASPDVRYVGVSNVRTLFVA
jgi:hypothetical protein